MKSAVKDQKEMYRMTQTFKIYISFLNLFIFVDCAMIMRARTHARTHSLSCKTEYLERVRSFLLSSLTRIRFTLILARSDHHDQWKKWARLFWKCVSFFVVVTVAVVIFFILSFYRYHLIHKFIGCCSKKMVGLLLFLRSVCFFSPLFLSLLDYLCFIFYVLCISVYLFFVVVTSNTISHSLKPNLFEFCLLPVFFLL